jgi:hypothetical protein
VVGDEPLVLGMIAIRREAVDVGEVGRDRVLEVAGADAEVAAVAVGDDLGDRTGERVECVGHRDELLVGDRLVPAEHDDVTDHPQSPIDLAMIVFITSFVPP